MREIEMIKNQDGSVTFLKDYSEVITLSEPRVDGKIARVKKGETLSEMQLFEKGISFGTREPSIGEPYCWVNGCRIINGVHTKKHNL